MKIVINVKHLAVTFAGVLYFLIFGCSPIWACVLIGPENILWENIWLGPAIALVVLTFCWFLERISIGGDPSRKLRFLLIEEERFNIAAARDYQESDPYLSGLNTGRAEVLRRWAEHPSSDIFDDKKQQN